jgi:hypothetical protein
LIAGSEVFIAGNEGRREGGAGVRHPAGGGKAPRPRALCGNNPVSGSPLHVRRLRRLKINCAQ